ncbi:MAG: hypothetical protein Q4B62_00745 [Clostridiaceae bacterium]|nr:hypothetical protein [Clostridiaceae bacterium]
MTEDWEIKTIIFSAGASPRPTLNGKFCIVDYRISSDRAGRRDWDDVGIVPYKLRIYSGTGKTRP